MISAAAVTLALAFWTPYNHGQPVCPGGVQIHNVNGYGAGSSVPSYAYTRRINGDLTPNCDVYVSPAVRSMPRAFQCGVIARALGTAWFGLPPSTDRRNVMYRDGWVIPSRCGASPASK